MESAVYKLINMKVKNVDKYVNNGSTWLIFTDRKQWVIELTKEGTLWYNYNFFKAVFSYFGLDVVENQHYITKWVEDNVIRDGVKVANKSLRVDDSCLIKDTVENGVKKTNLIGESAVIFSVQEAIENGVKATKQIGENGESLLVEDAIQNGIKHTARNNACADWEIEDVIENGVKRTSGNKIPGLCEIEDTIENGVKDTRPEVNMTEGEVEEIIENGVKETTPIAEWVNSKSIVDKTIQGGIKVTKTPGDDGDLLSTMEWMEENKTNSVPKLIDYVVKHGVKKTKSVTDNLIEILRSDKVSPHTYADESTQDSWVENVVKKGIKATNAWDDDIFGEPDRVKVIIKETNPTKFANFEDAIENGIKNTYSDKIPNDYDWSDEFESDVEDAIQNGINMTMGAYSSRLPNPVENVIKNGVKECVPVHHMLYNPMDFSVVYRENHRLDDVTSVLENGIKEVQPLPAQDGNMDWGNYYHRQEDRTKPHTEYVKDVIDNGSIIG